MEENKQITPSQYFDFIKGAKNKITTEKLKESYNVFINLAEKYNKLGQTESLKKLCFLAETTIKEEKLIELGICTYVYKDTIEDYITNVADKTVKIIELSRYMREIPDELVDVIEKSKTIFDELYVVFTDYTGKEERKVEKERRDKDPILFGVFKEDSFVADRFYFIGDWIDEYCDLTLDKMIEQYQSKKKTNPVNKSNIPSTSEELISTLKKYIPSKTETLLTLRNNDQSVSNVPIPVYNVDGNIKPKESFFSKIRSIFK